MKSAVYARYGLLCAIELAAVVLFLVVLQQWIAFPRWLFGLIVAGWIVKDGVLFPFVWRAYDPDAPGARTEGGMIGAFGIAKETLNPSGYVQVRGELWRAERDGGDMPIEAGSRVRVQHREGLTLFVVAENSAIREDAGDQDRP